MDAGTRHCRIGEQGLRSFGPEPLYTMPEAVKSARQLFLKAGGAGHGERIARWEALAEELEQRELREFKGAREILLAAFEMDRQLLAGGDAVVRIIDEFVPERGRSLVIATAFCQECE